MTATTISGLAVAAVTVAYDQQPSYAALGGVCVGPSMYDLTGDGYDSGIVDGSGNGLADQNAVDTTFDGQADLWLIDRNEDCVLDQGAQDIDRDLSPDLWIVDSDYDRVFDSAYTDSAQNGLPNMWAPMSLSTGLTLVIGQEPLGPAVSAGPMGQDILDALRRAPHANPAGNDYPGGVTMADAMNGLSNAGAPSS